MAAVAVMALLGGCAGSASPSSVPTPIVTPAPSAVPTAVVTPAPSAMPTAAPGLPASLFGIWAGDFYSDGWKNLLALTIHPCATPAPGSLDAASGHFDMIDLQISTLRGCSQYLTFVGMDGAAAVFQEGVTIDWGGSECGICTLALTPNPDGTLDAAPGGNAPVWAEPSP